MNKIESKIYGFIYACPVCREDAFLIAERIRPEGGSVAVQDVKHLVSWEDGVPRVLTDSIRCQRCRTKIRHIDPERIAKLNRPYVIPPKGSNYSEE